MPLLVESIILETDGTNEDIGLAQGITIGGLKGIDFARKLIEM